MIRKPALKSRTTPWRQDEAYWRPELTYHAVGVWLPLQPGVDERRAATGETPQPGHLRADGRFLRVRLRC